MKYTYEISKTSDAWRTESIAESGFVTARDRDEAEAKTHRKLERLVKAADDPRVDWCCGVELVPE